MQQVASATSGCKAIKPKQQQQQQQKRTIGKKQVNLSSWTPTAWASETPENRWHLATITTTTTTMWRREPTGTGPRIEFVLGISACVTSLARLGAGQAEGSLRLQLHLHLRRRHRPGSTWQWPSAGTVCRPFVWHSFPAKYINLQTALGIYSRLLWLELTLRFSLIWKSYNKWTLYVLSCINSFKFDFLWK